LSHTGYSVCS